MGDMESAKPWTEIRAGRAGIAQGVRELWSARELVGFLAARDVRVRYKQAVFGVLWAVLQPLAGAAIFTVVFYHIGGFRTEGTPYLLFAFTGFAVWSYFSATLTRATASLVENSSLVTKVYFPRLTVPVAAMLPGLIDLRWSLLLLFGLMALHGTATRPAILALPLCIALLVLFALAVGLWLSAWNVRYRDVRHVIPVVLQLWLFASPVAYPVSAIDERWQPYFSLNPMVGVLSTFRWALIGDPWPGFSLIVSVVATAVLLAGGLAHFQQVQRRFADVI